MIHTHHQVFRSIAQWRGGSEDILTAQPSPLPTSRSSHPTPSGGEYRKCSATNAEAQKAVKCVPLSEDNHSCFTTSSEPLPASYFLNCKRFIFHLGKADIIHSSWVTARAGTGTLTFYFQNKTHQFPTDVATSQIPNYNCSSAWELELLSWGIQGASVKLAWFWGLYLLSRPRTVFHVIWKFWPVAPYVPKLLGTSKPKACLPRIICL